MLWNVTSLQQSQKIGQIPKFYWRNRWWCLVGMTDGQGYNIRKGYHQRYVTPTIRFSTSETPFRPENMRHYCLSIVAPLCTVISIGNLDDWFGNKADLKDASLSGAFLSHPPLTSYRFLASINALSTSLFCPHKSGIIIPLEDLHLIQPDTLSLHGLDTNLEITVCITTQPDQEGHSNVVPAKTVIRERKEGKKERKFQPTTSMRLDATVYSYPFGLTERNNGHNCSRIIRR